MSLFDILITVSLILWILVCLGLIVALGSGLRFLQELRARRERYDRFFEVLERRVAPLLDRAEYVVDNTQYLSSVLRADVETVSRSVSRAARSADRIMEMAEERAAELNGLLEVVQEEAEETFLSTASLLRAIRGARRRRKRLTRGERVRRRLG
ncbi:MAG: hypothetical protein ACE5JR_04310 [Gemmatimonadota bacterium]